MPIALRYVLSTVLALCACVPAATRANLLVVNSTADPGDGTCTEAHCTLREALATPKPADDFSTLIQFAIPGPGPHVIQPNTLLPTISHNTEIAGFSQPGSIEPDPNTGLGFLPPIVLDGSLLPDSGAVYGLRVVATRFNAGTIRGLSLVNFSRPAGDGAAVWLDGAAADANASIIGDSFIGLRPDGITVGANDIGVRVTADADTDVGNNVIAGNGVGVLTHARASFNGTSVFGNRIGTNPAGTAPIPNSSDGVRVLSTCSKPAQEFAIVDNVIGGNGRDGVHLVGESAACSQLTGDFARIQANRIGIGRNNADLGNGRHGVGVGLAAVNGALLIGPQLNSSAEEDENLIAYNGGAGVAVFASGDGAVIRQNTFLDNLGLPIDLGADGSTPNDPGDADTGANRRINTPELGAARTVGFDTTVPFRVTSVAPHVRYPLRIDFYRLFDGRITFIDSVDYTTPNAVQTIVLDASVDDRILAVTSDDIDSEFEDRSSRSSEFSAPALRVLFADGFE